MSGAGGRTGAARQGVGAVVLPGAGQGAAAAPTFALNTTHALSLDQPKVCVIRVYTCPPPGSAC